MGARKSAHGVHGTYIDDLLRAYISTFRDICNKIHTNFDTSEDEHMQLTYAGYEIWRDRDHCITIDQSFYLKKLGSSTVASTYREFASSRLKLAWQSYFRPDLLY